MELHVPGFDLLLLCYYYSEIISSVILGGWVDLVQLDEAVLEFIIPSNESKCKALPMACAPCWLLVVPPAHAVTLGQALATELVKVVLNLGIMSMHSHTNPSFTLRGRTEGLCGKPWKTGLSSEEQWGGTGLKERTRPHLTELPKPIY